LDEERVAKPWAFEPDRPASELKEPPPARNRIAVESPDEAAVIVPRTREPRPKFKPFDLALSAPWLHRPPRQFPRPVDFNAREQALVERIKRLKKEAGSHSPSAWTLAKLIPELRLKVDACFLSNPYATNLFLMHLHREVIRPRKLRALLELYPSQNRVIAAKLGRVLDLEPETIFVGNGAVEIIQAILHRFTREKILVNLPTFSPYYEFARPDTQVAFNVLRKEEDFHFDPARYLELVHRERPDTVVLINPNNPDGGYIPYATMIELLEGLRDVPNVIVDESFIHFACEGIGYAYWSIADEVRRFPNLMVVKSMSKDFGVAGIRAGYAVMAPTRVQLLLENGYLWNSSGLAEYFFDLYSRPDFQERYERERIRFIRNSRRFFAALDKIQGLRVYPTHANFALVELENGLSAEDLVWRMLVRRGIYTRTCDDKRGLEPGKFVRIAARNRPENAYIIRSLRRMIG
jgi:histidinol-phosphate/aromatic aminotransferase/cobyric acid decarboxylase-like protein